MLIKNSFVNNQKSMEALELLSKKPLPMKAAYSVAKIKTACEKQSHKFFPEYIKILTKYCHMNEDGSFKELNGKDTYTVKDECMEDFKKEVGALLDQEFEVTKTDLLTPELFGDVEVEPVILKELLPILN